MPILRVTSAGLADDSNVLATFGAPRRWLRVGKYLLPVGMTYPRQRRTRSPREQVRVSQLATDHPDSVQLQTAGSAEVLPEWEYECRTSGKLEMGVLPSEFVAPAFVARLRDGMSFGRHCCVIGPAGKAVRETGFNLDGRVLASRKPISRYRPQYWRRRWEGDVTSRPWLPPKQHLAGTVAVLNTRFSHNFYHWLIDILPRLVPLARSGARPDFYMVDCLTPFQRTVFAALGITPAQLIQPHCRLLVEADELLVPSLPTPDCLREFSRMLLGALNVAANARRARRIYISRKKTGKRTLANEAELERLLGAYRFETHSMEDYSLAQQARLVHESDVIVATHGAGLANLLFARPGTQVVEIVPAGRYNATCYPTKSRIFGLHHQLVFAERGLHKQIMRLALADVEAALVQAERMAHRSAAA
jgi:hypothetical protein